MLIGAPNCAADEITKLLPAFASRTRSTPARFPPRNTVNSTSPSAGAVAGACPVVCSPGAAVDCAAGAAARNAATSAAAAAAVKCRTDRIHSGYQYVCSWPYRPNIERFAKGRGLSTDPHADG